MADHVLLTGATGLLGRYLLRDLLLQGIEVAVLVRPDRRSSAEQRVDGLLDSWERVLKSELPRPHVLEGDISQPNLGLDEWERNWVADHCDTVLHNAASLTFEGTDRAGEPWRSNVDGTRHVLELCRESGIRDLFHVSTAYVCGLRRDRVLEVELDVGQEPGNDYERSKIEAEKLIRAADFLGPPTIFRPAIIIGDSTNGFTTTFHGFYAMLHLSHTLLKSAEIDGTGNGQPTRLTLDGTESKNLVPVDWVSAVIAYILTKPEHHGQTYHLTPQRPVTTHMMREALEHILANPQFTRFVGSSTVLENPTEVEKLFYEQIRVYDSYWRDDPRFDASNTHAAAPHLPCPDVDHGMLVKMSTAAIEMGFRWKDRLVSQPTEMPR